MRIAGDEWQGRTGESWAAEWRRTDRSFGALTEHLLLRSRGLPFAHVADIGCGAGELSLALARGRPHISVVGVDISGQLITVARERGSHLANVSFELADAAQWQPESDAPDLLVSRHGVMFFADPAAAFAHLALVAAPGAALLFSCFRSMTVNPVFNEVARLLPNGPRAPEPGPGPFAFADREVVGPLLQKAGWSAVEFEPFDFGMIVGAGEDPVADAVAYFSRIGPAAASLAEMTGSERERCLQRIAELAERNRFDDMVALRAGAWIVTAQKA